MDLFVDGSHISTQRSLEFVPMLLFKKEKERNCPSASTINALFSPLPLPLSQGGGKDCVLIQTFSYLLQFTLLCCQHNLTI